MSVENELRSLRQEVDELAGSITQFVRLLEQDNRLRERAESAEEKELDRRHEFLIETLDGIKRSSEAVGVALRDLPDRLLNHIEKKIYELRVARYEAQQAGVANEPAPLPPPPGRRDPTSKVIAMVEGKDDDVALTAAQQRGIVKIVKKVWDYKFHIGGGAIGFHWLAERGAAIWEWIKHLH